MRDLKNGYNSRTTFKCLVSKRWEREITFDEEELRCLKILWKLKASFRVQILVWRIFKKDCQQR
jgi:hypothetical protein